MCVLYMCVYLHMYIVYCVILCKIHNIGINAVWIPLWYTLSQIRDTGAVHLVVEADTEVVSIGRIGLLLP